MARQGTHVEKPIALVGLMGAGKSTVGRRLAARLRLPFVDTDEEIEQAAGLSVAEIFARFGEAHFRDGERRVIARVIGGPRAVVATGGGAFVQEDTRQLLLAHASVVWLDADVSTLVRRVSGRDHRPLLTGRDPATVLGELARQRNPIYALAPIRVASNPAPHSATVDAIIGALLSAALTAGQPAPGSTGPGLDGVQHQNGRDEGSGEIATPVRVAEAPTCR